MNWSRAIFSLIWILSWFHVSFWRFCICFTAISHLLDFCSDFSRNQRWRRQEAPGCRDLHLQWPYDAHKEGFPSFYSLKSKRSVQITIIWSLITSLWICLQSLTGIKGLSEAKVDKICEAAEKLVVRTPILVWNHFSILRLCLIVRLTDSLIFRFRNLVFSE